MTRAASKGHLCDLYKQLTHGGNYWRDQYLLEYWDQCVQPVVYRNDYYHGYKLLRRLGDWCWLTRGAKTKYWPRSATHPWLAQLTSLLPSAYLTVKFLSRGRGNDLQMNMFLK